VEKEAALLHEIERAIDLERLLGPRACEMLRSGYKIELEGNWYRQRLTSRAIGLGGLSRMHRMGKRSQAVHSNPSLDRFDQRPMPFPSWFKAFWIRA
jgi:hypothetical protein